LLDSDSESRLRERLSGYLEELGSNSGGSGCCVYFEQAKSTAGVAGKHRYAIKGPNCVDRAVLVALQHFKAASGLGFPNPHRAVM
jgi:hypothetical protein